MATVDFKYYTNEVSFDEENFLPFNEEVWRIGYAENVEPSDPNRPFLIVTPHGTLYPEGFDLNEDGPMVGIQFDTIGYIDLSAYGHPDKEFVQINRVAIMRQPHNVWVWVYLIDNHGECAATFCGHDDLDGLADFVDFLKKEFS